MIMYAPVYMVFVKELEHLLLPVCNRPFELNKKKI